MSFSAILYNKNTPIMKCKMDNDTGAIFSVEKVLNLEYLPIGINDITKSTFDEQSLVRLNDWWRTRAIPATRDGILDGLRTMGLDSCKALLNKAFGMSLSDQYWFCPNDIDVEWKDVCFFRNDFSNDVGDIIFDNNNTIAEVNLHSPDNTSDGWLKKRWKICDGKRILFKGGSNPFNQEPFNEVIASKILENFTTSSVKYFLVKNNDDYVSGCENFISEDEELVSAYNLYHAIPELRKEDKLDHIKRCIDYFEIPNAMKYINDMIISDYIILNTDRHEGNFGFIRNVNTLKFTRPAPIFDNGTSLWHNQGRILPTYDKCQPFRTTHSKQIKLVTDSIGIDFDGIKKAIDEIPTIFNSNHNIDAKRINSIHLMTKSRFSRLINKI